MVAASSAAASAAADTAAAAPPAVATAAAAADALAARRRQWRQFRLVRYPDTTHPGSVPVAPLLTPALRVPSTSLPLLHRGASESDVPPWRARWDAPVDSPGLGRELR
jgi:hypothetical protein